MVVSHSHAQQIVWQKQFGWISGDELKVVCSASQGTYLGAGIVRKFGTNRAFGSAIVKFDSNGDTLFIKNLNLLCQSWGLPYIGKSWNGNYLLVVNVQMTISTNLFARYPAIVEFNEQGSILQAKLFPQHEFCIVTGVKKSSDEGLMLTGYKSSLDVFHTDSMFAMKVNFLLEQEWANKYSNIANAPYRGQHLERLANRNYLVSGALGKRVYGIEIDSTGQWVNEKIYYQTPSNRVFNEAKLYQGFGNNSTFSQSYYLNGSNNYVGVFARHHQNGNKIWGGELEGMIYNGLVLNREGSLIYARNGPDGLRAFNIFKDSTAIWDIQLGEYAGAYRYVNGLCFTTPDSGIIYGFFDQNSGNLGRQFWIAKIAGVGTQYNPANPDDTVSVEERFFRPKDSPTLYPNPSTERIQFKKLNQETQVAIYSSTGKKLMEKMILPDGYLDICLLPPGVYLYHLKMGDRVFTGRFKKE
jgi:hypothetical protein